MKVSLCIVRDADGKVSVPYAGEDIAGALAAAKAAPHGAEVMVLRNPKPFKRHGGARKAVQLIVEPAPPAQPPAPETTPEPVSEPEAVVMTPPPTPRRAKAR